MFKTVGESVGFARELARDLSLSSGREVVVAPPFTALHAVAGALGGTAIQLAAQNVHDRPQGAFTGEISASMLVDAGCRYAIIGHSERRTLFGETDAFINRKMAAALSVGLNPIFCIGETLEEREQEKTFPVVERQIRDGLNNLAEGDIRKVLIAYEPVWAIGTGKTATPAQAQAVHAFIRGIIDGLSSPGLSQDIRVIYGGSVNPGNITALMKEADIDGALVGGASLEVGSFLEIINYT